MTPIAPGAVQGLAVAAALLQRQGGSTFPNLVDEPVVALMLAGGLGLLSAALAAAVAVLHRWYARETAPLGLTILVGTSGVALWLNADAILTQARDSAIPPAGEIATSVLVFGVAAFAAAIGGRLGDRVGFSLFAETPDVNRLVNAVGRHTVVVLPEDVEDIPEYDPVPDDVKADLAAAEFRFPRRLTVEALRERVVARVKKDYGVGHVDLELSADGAVDYLAVGSRVAGIGPTLPPGTAAVAIRADPANSASAGDVVQVWRDGERVVTGELRAVAGDTVTLAVDREDVTALDPHTDYRLVTLPAAVRDDRQFASLLRAADETMGVVTAAETGSLVGTTVGSLTPAIVAVRSPDGAVTALPPRSHVLSAGEVVYAVARPDALRRLEAAADGDADPPLAAVADD